MTGFYGGEVPDNITLRSAGTSALPSTTGQVLGAELGEGFAHAFPTFEAGRATAEEGIDPNSGMPLPEGTFGPTLSADEANARFGIDGALSWRNPVPEGVAREMSVRKHDELLRQDIIARGEGGIGSGVLGIGAQLAGGLPGLIDPLNIAASFVPVVGEARAALWASRPLGRLALGAAQGAAGQAALLPVQAALASHDQEDLTMTNALLDVALGGVMGGGLHVLAGGRGDALVHADPAAAMAVASAPPQAAEAILREGVAALADDRLPAIPERVLEPTEEQLGRSDTPSAMPGPAWWEEPTPAGNPDITPYERIPREPMRLAEFLRGEGGLQDQGGELAAVDAGRRRPGLVNGNGLNLDTATLRAWEAGYLPGEDRPEINALLDHLDRDLRGNPVYSDQDALAAEARAHALGRNEEIDRLSGELNIEVRGKTRDQFWNAVADSLSQDDLAREIVARDAAYDEAAAAAEEHMRGPGAADRPFDTGRPRTLDEMDAEHAELDRQTQIAVGPRPSSGGIGRPERAAIGQGVVQEGARQRGRGARFGPSENPEGDFAGSRAEPREVGDETDAEIAEPEQQIAQTLFPEETQGQPERPRMPPQSRLTSAIAGGASSLQGLIARAGGARRGLSEMPIEYEDVTAELRAIDEAQARGKAWVDVIERAGICLARRA